MMSSLLHVSFVPFIYRTSAPLRVHRCNHRQYSTIYGAIYNGRGLHFSAFSFVKGLTSGLFNPTYYSVVHSYIQLSECMVYLSVQTSVGEDQLKDTTTVRRSSRRIRALSDSTHHNTSPKSKMKQFKTEHHFQHPIEVRVLKYQTFLLHPL